MFLVGLTGGIASGKSSVSDHLIELGIPVIDADTIAKKVVRRGKRAWQKIKDEFGEDVIMENGELNRPRLASIVFNDVGKRKKLNSITHPEIYKYMIWECIRYMMNGHQFVVLDVPLLYETKKLLKLLSFVIVVFCDERQQMERLRARNGFSYEEAKSRIESQLALSEKCARADAVIDNSKTFEQTVVRTNEIVERLRKKRTHWKLRFIVLAVVVSVSSIFLRIFHKLIFQN